ncbi:MAG: aminoglycoside phosphotransferase family protein [Gammaproteobacteria bacterium]|nr:aminoglycoside phosphotransferase family protein [Gammaproteobacteria bacterium]
MFKGDFGLYANDAALPGLHHLSLDRLQAVIERDIPCSVTQAPASSYSISNVRYKSGRKLVLGMMSESGGKPIGLRIYPIHEAQHRLARLRAGEPARAFALPEIDGIAWVYPAANKLDLRILDDRKALAALLLAERGMTLDTVELVRFVPEQSCTARVRGYRAGTQVTEYLKIQTEDQGAATALLMRDLAAQTHGGVLSMPTQVSYLPEYRLLLQSSVPRAGSERISLFDAARGLAAFHGLNSHHAPFTINFSMPDTASTIALVEHAAPQLVEPVKRLIAQVASYRIAPTGHPPVLVHGDAHPGNLFPAPENRIGIIDVDRCHRGRPEYDIASFMAIRLWIALREGCDPFDVLPGLGHLVATYNQYARYPVTLDDARYFVARSLLTERVYRGISRGKTTGDAELATFIALGESLIRDIGKC